MDQALLDRLRRRARRLAATDCEAEDLVQEVVARYLEQRALGRDIARPLAYMMTALRHASAARNRASRRETALDSAPEPLVEDAARACLCAEVLSKIATLPAADRDLLRRVIDTGAGPREIARDLGLPVGTVMSRLARARSRLRKALDLGEERAAS